VIDRRRGIRMKCDPNLAPLLRLNNEAFAWATGRRDFVREIPHTHRPHF
jgi:hypothetical protein